MRIKSKTLLAIWLGVIFASFLVGSILFLHESHPGLMVMIEILIPFIYMLTIWIINRAFRPIGVIARSMHLLNEEDFSVKLLESGHTDINQIITIYNSMVEHLRQERLTVREQHHFLDLLIDSSPVGIIILDFDGRIMRVNPSGRHYLKLDETEYIGAHFEEINHPLVAQMNQIGYDKKRTIELSDGQKYLCRKLYFMDQGFKHPFYYLEEFTEEIRQAEKKAYGKLIRMMAHEVNNTIGAVNSIMSTVSSLDKAGGPDEWDEVISMLKIAIQRNQQLTRFMQNFSNVVRIPMPERKKYNLGDSLKGVLRSFQPRFNDNQIVVDLHLPGKEIDIIADPNQMDQVWINLVKNAIEAIGENGRILITVNPNPLSLRIADSGQGISQEVADRIFTPFFSTKVNGQGIGLTLIREILINHGFSIQYQTSDLGGAEFAIKLDA